MAATSTGTARATETASRERFTRSSSSIKGLRGVSARDATPHVDGVQAGRVLLATRSGALRRRRLRSRLLRRGLGLLAAGGHDRRAERLHQVDDRRLQDFLRRLELAAVELGLEHLLQRGAVLAHERLGLERRVEARDDLPREVELGRANLSAADSLVDLVLRLDVLVDEERLEHERIALGANQRELLLAGEPELAERRDALLLHRLEQQRVGAALRLGTGGDEEVGAIEEDRIDLLEPDEARDVDRARGVVLLERLEVGVLDDHELALRDLPAADELVCPDLDLVHRAPPLLLDRRAALAMQLPERDVGLPGSGLRRRGKPDGDVHEPEAQGSVPGSPHTDAVQIVEG